MIEVEIDKDVYLPCYHHILDDTEIDIEFLWGGRDSGKSKFMAQYLTETAMSADYFRCLLIKETHESIKDAQWQTIKDVCDDWGVDGLFKFGTSPLSISCVNGNKFITRGMNQPARIKSISNPSHAWVEEGNQISKDSFITLITSLRSDKGNVKLYFTFNPEATNEPDFEEFWLYKMFFKKYLPLKSFTGEIVIKSGNEEIRLRYRSTHVTYKNNPYVTPQRRAIHESLQEENYYWYRVFTLGEWGNEENDNPWAFAFKREKHVSPVELKPNRMLDLWLSFDFNRSPAACTVIQHDEDEETVYVLETIMLNKAGTEDICEYVLVKYPNYLYVVTGDYSGNTPSSIYKEEVTNYTLIKRMLRLSDGQLKVKTNPRLEKNQTLVNSVLYRYKVQICPVNAKGLIFDLEKVKKKSDGTIMKDNRKDPTQRSDILDGFRYYINLDFENFLKQD